MLPILDGARVARREARTLVGAVPIVEFRIARDLSRIGSATDAIEKLAH